MKKIFAFYFAAMLAITSSHTFAQTTAPSEYLSNIGRIAESIDPYIRRMLGQYDSKNNCHIKRITEEMAREGDYGEASYFCMNLQEIEYLKSSNAQGDVYSFFAILGGRAATKKSELIETLPNSNLQAGAYYLLSGSMTIPKKSGGKPIIRHNKYEFLTTRQEQGGVRIVCLASNRKIGFLFQPTWYLGQGLRGMEFDSETYIAELSSGQFSDRLNFIQTKTDGFQKFKDGRCVK